MAGLVLNTGVKRREAWAWAGFDFANSGYTTVVITAIYNAYFVGIVAGNAPWATLLWGVALAISNGLIMLTGPALGRWADEKRAKKRLLIWTTAGCVLTTLMLAQIDPKAIAWSLLFVILSSYCFGLGENLIAAFLPELARREGMGRLSGFGWGFGYLGGLLTLGLCLVWVAHGQATGLTAHDFVPGTLWITAALFVLASLPTFIWLKERGGGESAPRLTWVTVRQTLSGFIDLRRFLLCLLAYQSGVQAVIALAAVYAEQAMGFDTRQSITLILAVNLAAAIGAVLFGFVQDRIGHKATLRLTLMGWLMTILLAWEAGNMKGDDAVIIFWIAAHLAGFCLGSSQSAGRALVGYLSPPQREAEFFAYWGLAVKFSAILGPLAYGSVVWLSGGQHRIAMLLLAPFFLMGLGLLRGVDLERGNHHLRTFAHPLQP